MQPISRILFAVQKGSANYDEWVISCLEGAWPQIVGDILARFCRPHCYRAPVLEVKVVDETRVEVFNGLRDDIQEKVREFTGGAVTTLIFIQ